MKSVVINRIIIFPYMISIIRNSLSSWRSFKILSFNQNKGDIINFEFHVLFCFLSVYFCFSVCFGPQKHFEEVGPVWL